MPILNIIFVNIEEIYCRSYTSKMINIFLLKELMVMVYAVYSAMVNTLDLNCLSGSSSDSIKASVLTLINTLHYTSLVLVGFWKEFPCD